MKKFIYIGITIFLLIIISFQYTITNTNSNDKSTEETEQQATKSNNIVFYGKFPLPVENYIRTSSKFGNRNNPTNSKGGNEHHTGLDLVGQVGSNVIAITQGKVSFAGVQGGYGCCVEIQHYDEKGQIFYSFYGHMRENSIKVNIGQTVEQGTIIGTQGSTRTFDW